MRAAVTRALIVIGVVLPSMAWAQSATTGAIAGEVRDTTGAVLPGVTVEASSPALIEKVRTVVTDDQGRYQIVELRPGRYMVTFTLGYSIRTTSGTRSARTARTGAGLRTSCWAG